MIKSLTVGFLALAAVTTVSAQTLLSPFDQLEINGPVQVEVYYSDVEKMEFPAGYDESSLQVEVEDNRLEISGGVKDKSTGPIKLYVKSLKEVEISGVATLSFKDTLREDNLEIEASGATTLDGNLRVGKLNLEVEGASEVTLRGGAEEADVEASGATYLQLQSLEVKKMNLDISGASSASVNVSQDLYLDGSGVYTLKIEGNPLIHRNSGESYSFPEKKDEDKVIDNSNKRVPYYWNNFVWMGVDLGVNGFVDKGGRFQPASPYDFMELNYGKSANVRLNLLEYKIKFNRKRTINLVPGIGIEWNHYSFQEKIFLQEREELNTPGIATSLVDGKDSTMNFVRTRLVTKSLNLPLFLNFATPRKFSSQKQFNFSVGVVTNFLIGSNFRTTRFENNEKVREKFYRDYGLGNVNATAMIRVRYWFLNFYASYTFTDLFRGPDSPFLKGWSAGFSFSL